MNHKLYYLWTLATAISACNGETNSTQDASTEDARIDASDSAMDSAGDARLDAGAGDAARDSGVACSEASPCPDTECSCVSAGESCGVSSFPVQASRCSGGVCASAAEICPSACQAVGREWRAGGDSPAETSFGTAWTPIATPSSFDAITAVDGMSDNAFYAIAASGYPQSINIRTKIWKFENGVFTDVTPTQISNPPSGVEYEQVRGLAMIVDGSFAFTSQERAEATTWSLTRVVAGVVQEKILPAELNFADFGPLTARGNTFFGGGLSAARVGAAFSLQGTTPTALTMPATAQTAINAITTSATEVFASSTARIYRGTGSTLSEIALPTNWQPRTIAYANGRLYALLTLQATQNALWSYDLSQNAWTQVCMPRSAEPSNVQALRDGWLFVASDQGGYLTDGSVWQRLPSDVSRVYGSHSELYGFKIAFDGGGSANRLTL